MASLLRAHEPQASLDLGLRPGPHPSLAADNTCLHLSLPRPRRGTCQEMCQGHAKVCQGARSCQGLPALCQRPAKSLPEHLQVNLPMPAKGQLMPLPLPCHCTGNCPRRLTPTHVFRPRLAGARRRHSTPPGRPEPEGHHRSCKPLRSDVVTGCPSRGWPAPRYPMSVQEQQLLVVSAGVQWSVHMS